MFFEVLVEESSAEAALDNLIPRIVPGITRGVEFDIHPHQGKLDLLAKLPRRLQGYRHWLPEDWRIIVLIDEDRESCTELKKDLEDIARAAGLLTRAIAEPGRMYQIVNRLAVEELEAWFFGDVVALVAAYPRLNPNLGKKAKYRDPDAIKGGTWETLERVLRRAGYYLGGLPKIEVARTVSDHMDPDRNTSKSFQVFRDALRQLTQADTAK